MTRSRRIPISPRLGPRPSNSPSSGRSSTGSDGGIIRMPMSPRPGWAWRAYRGTRGPRGAADWHAPPARPRRSHPTANRSAQQTKGPGAVGYGLATVAAALPVRSWRGHDRRKTLPHPPPADYQSRLSWVPVFRIFDWLNCPGVTSTTAPSAGGRYAGYYYEVFIIDA